MRSLSRPLSRPVSRRGVQALLAGAVLAPLTGCDLLPERTPAEPPQPTADELLVDHVVSAVRTARDVAAAAGAAALAAVHEAHLTALGSPAPTSGAASPAASAGTPGPAELRSAELALEASLTDAALRAEDGGLARRLASMAAAIAQQVAVLPVRGSAR